MLWCWLFIRLSLSWTHNSSNKLISTYHTHTIYLLMTFSRWALYWIGNWSWVVISRFCATSDITWLYNDTVFAWNPWITNWWVMIWLKFAVPNTFTVILIWIVLQTIQIDRIPIGWSSYISWRSHIVLFVLQFLWQTIDCWIMWFMTSTHHHSFWSMAVAETVLF